MPVPLDNVDFSRKTAMHEDSDPLSDPMIRALRRLMPYHPMWDDPVKVKQFHDSLLDAMTNGRDEAKGATPQEIARVRQAEPENRTTNLLTARKEPRNGIEQEEL